MLEPDAVRGLPLDMDQYTRLFGTARIPTDVRSGVSMLRVSFSDQYVPLERLQDGGPFGVKTHCCPQKGPILYVYLHASSVFSGSLDRPIDWFDVLDTENRPVLTEREVLRNLQAIVADADKLPIHEVRAPFGYLLYETY